jgi:hypothetical protein
MIVYRAGYEGICPRSDGNERVVETKALHQDPRPGGQLGERGQSGDVAGDLECRLDGEGIRYDGNEVGKDGATSAPRRSSK